MAPFLGFPPAAFAANLAAFFSFLAAFFALTSSGVWDCQLLVHRNRGEKNVPLATPILVGMSQRNQHPRTS